MARARAKLTDADVTAIRKLAATGKLTQQAIAEEFGTTRQHVSRIVRGEQRQPLPAVDVDREASVTAAVWRLLQAGDFDPEEDVAAATALALAEKLESVRRADTAQSAIAAPGLARQLAETVTELREAAGDVGPRLGRLRGKEAVLMARELGYPDPETIDVEHFGELEVIRLARARRLAAKKTPVPCQALDDCLAAASEEGAG